MVIFAVRTGPVPCLQRSRATDAQLGALTSLDAKVRRHGSGRDTGQHDDNCAVAAGRRAQSGRRRGVLVERSDGVVKKMKVRVVTGSGLRLRWSKGVVKT